MVIIFQEAQYAGPVSDIKLTGMEVELLTHFGLANESIQVCMHVVKTTSHYKGRTSGIFTQMSLLLSWMDVCANLSVNPPSSL